MKTTLTLIFLSLLLLPSAAFSQDPPMTGEQVYHKTCHACHDNGIAGAPKLGDKQAWADHLAEEGGVEHLYQRAIEGEGAMPPKGGNGALTDEEVKAAVDYMLEKSK